MRSRLIRSVIATVAATGALVLAATACGGEETKAKPKPAASASASKTEDPQALPSEDEFQDAWDETMGSNRENQQKFMDDTDKAALDDSTLSDPTEAQRTEFLDRLNLIDPSIAIDEDMAVQRGMATCDEIVRAEPEDKTITHVEIRYSDRDVDLPDSDAVLIIQAVRDTLCY